MSYIPHIREDHTNFLTAIAMAGPHACTMGPLYMVIRHPDGEHYMCIDSPMILELAIEQGHIDPSWDMELAYMPGEEPARTAREIRRAVLGGTEVAADV